MKTIIIKTQNDIDSLPDSFQEFTVIEIRSESEIVIRKNYGNSQVRAYDSSQVRAYDSSQVRAYDNSRVTACDNSQVTAYGNSQVTAYGNSQVAACDNSQVTACDNSQVAACDNSQVTACDNSQVRAYDSSQVTAYDSSQVTAYGNSQVTIFSTLTTIKELRDSSIAIYRDSNCPLPLSKDKTSRIVPFIEPVTPSFETWLSRGIVYADGIYEKLVRTQSLGNATVYEVTDDFGSEKSYVARSGNKFAHGETVASAIEDLRYKISDRDTSKYQSWKLRDIKSTDEIIEAYMTITGACSMGTKEFCQRMQLKDSYKLSEIVSMTEGAYGHTDFKNFLEKN